MDRQIKVLFVFTANQYNVLNEMLWKLADCLERKHGFLVGKHRLDDYEKICGYEWDVVFCGQAIEFSKLQKVDGRVHMTWFVDHPRYLLPRILPYEQKENVWIGCVDRRHMAFLKKYYGIRNTFFAPHFGWKAKKLLAEPNASYQNRKYGLFFPASNVRWEEDVACRYPGLTGALRTIAEETIRLLLEHTEIPLEEAMEAVLTRYGETEVLELSRECLEAAGEYIDFYVRIYARNKVIRALLNAGITVTVCGRNWSEFPENETERAHLQILGEELPYEEAIEVMADSKVVLNVMPWFKDGSHERIAMGSMNGAVCVTDASEYVSEVWGKTGVVYYDWRKPDELIEKLRALSEDKTEAERIAAEGQRIAEENVSIDNFAEEIIKQIEAACERVAEGRKKVERIFDTDL